MSTLRAPGVMLVFCSSRPHRVRNWGTKYLCERTMKERNNHLNCELSYYKDLWKKKVQYFSDGQFLLSDVARHVDHLHSVSQRFGNSVGNIGSTNEKHLEKTEIKQILFLSSLFRHTEMNVCLYCTFDRSTGTSK